MKTVGIVGCQPRIGTTTQALQLTLCLMHMGYNVAYVEMGERDYIEKLDALYQGITIDKNEIIYCQSIPLYTGSRIALANRGRYDYVIKDYGCIGNPGFEKISFFLMGGYQSHRSCVIGGFGLYLRSLSGWHSVSWQSLHTLIRLRCRSPPAF